MKALNKWDYEKHEYVLVVYLNDDYNFSKHCINMDKLVTCPHCLKDYRSGNMFTSLEFHDEIGLAYSVCDNCYEQEWERRKKYKEKTEK